jgi:hypothetical protein
MVGAAPTKLSTKRTRFPFHSFLSLSATFEFEVADHARHKNKKRRSRQNPVERGWGYCALFDPAAACQTLALQARERLGQTQVW